MENLNETLQELKKENSKNAKSILENLNDKDLLSIAKEIDSKATFRNNDQILINKIRSELFKRNGLGYKQVSHLSIKQRNFLESLNLKSRKKDYENINSKISSTEPIELSQKVFLSPDSSKEIVQFANYDPSDQWICITNDGNCISLSVENWRKLQDLTNKAIGL